MMLTELYFVSWRLCDYKIRERWKKYSVDMAEEHGKRNRKLHYICLSKKDKRTGSVTTCPLVHIKYK